MYCLLFTAKSFGQNKIFVIYQDDSIQNFFKERNKINGFYYDINNLKDSLQDGTYIFYNVRRQDSLLKQIFLKGQYLNNKKEGRFECFYYLYKSKKRIVGKSSQHVCNFKHGVMNGIEEENIFCNSGKYSSIIMVSHREYFDGKKDGLFMFFENGYPTNVSIYKNDSLINVLMNRE